ncbi:MAG: class I SAM-dependent methyltransferase [Candidatus Omnitrophica bacterium]|nr:class I SAM-dependent methyltransferase [Candidatus Omnitrophota bacterium]
MMCERAMREGLKIDLSGCNYGETTGPCRFIKRPTNYYYFLAGLVRSQRMTRILEIGTHFGGSIMSMSRGLNKKDIPKSKLVTVDIERKNRDGFKEYSHIKHVTGNSLDEEVIKKVCECFEVPIDLIYIDSLHEYEHTKKNIEIYAKSLNPRYIALDDIRQCDSMVELWSALTQEFKENTLDVSDITIRKGAGFGVIKWRRI